MFRMRFLSGRALGVEREWRRAAFWAVVKALSTEFKPDAVDDAVILGPELVEWFERLRARDRVPVPRSRCGVE
eukprot:15447953-Alexandrium_andersonii.AAC.1